MAESAIQTAIIKELRTRGAWVVKVHNTGRGRRGTPDVLACYRGRFIAIECKNVGGKATDQQLAELRAIQAAGGHAFVCCEPPFVSRLLDAIDQAADVPPPLFTMDALAEPNVVHLDSKRASA